MWIVHVKRVSFSATISSFGLGSDRRNRRELLLGLGCAELDFGDSFDRARRIVSVMLVRVWFPLLDCCRHGH
jgi:hypothetical protein